MKRDKIIDTAISELGNHDLDVSVYPSRYYSGGYNWCAEFVCYCYKEAGYPLTGGQFSSQVETDEDGDWMHRTTGRLIDYFTVKHEFIDRNHKKWFDYIPRPGDFVWIGRHNYEDGSNDRLHAGLVEYSHPDGTLHTIEGNNSKRPVMRFCYPRYKTNLRNNGSANGIVMGFGVLSE